MRTVFGDRSFGDLWDEIKLFFWRLFAPECYQTLWCKYQNLRKAMDERDEEYEIDISDADRKIKELEEKCRRLDARNRKLRMELLTKSVPAEKPAGRE